LPDIAARAGVECVECVVCVDIGRCGARADAEEAEPVEEAEERIEAAAPASLRPGDPDGKLAREAVEPSAAAAVDRELSHPSGATGSTNVDTGVPARSKAGRREYASAVAAMPAADASAPFTTRPAVAGGRHGVGR
jgi:hypothetical protein